MNKEKELAKNTTILFIGIFFTKIVQYFLLPVYTGYLTTREYGEYDLYNTIVSLLIPIIGLQIEQGTFRFLASNRNDDNEIKTIISSSFFSLLLSFIVFFLLFIILNDYFLNKYKYLILINLGLACFSSYVMQIIRGFGNNKEYSISSFLTSFFTIVINIVLLVGLGLKVDGMLYGAIAGSLIGLTYLSVKVKIYKYISYKYISKNKIKELLKYSLPLIPFNLSYWIFTFSDRFIVTYFLGLSSTGILSIAYKFSNIIVIIYNVFNMSLIESMSVHIDDEDISDYFNNIFKKISIGFTSIGCSIIVFLPFIFKYIINESFSASYNLIPIGIMAVDFQVYASLLSSIYFAKNKTKSIALTSFIAAIINVIVDLLLIRIIGVNAAIVSTIISYIVLFIYRVVDVNKSIFKIIIDKNLIYFMFISTINLILFYKNNIVLNIINILITIPIIIILNINNFKYLFLFLKKR